MIKFDCYKKEYKSPVGAARCNDKIRFVVEITDSSVKDVSLVVRKNDSSKIYSMRRIDDTGFFECFVVFESVGIYNYRFELVCENRMCFVGTRDGHTATVGDWLPEWYIAAYDEHFHTSVNLSGSVMYQIFPDRFNRAEDVEPQPCHNERIIHQNWNERPHCFYDYPDYKCNDFFMGNLKGIEQKLDYLSSLGVTHLYLNPIFESAENHRYSTSDYMNIDPYLGTNQHFKDLCKKAEEYDISVILDGVFSHTGDDSIYFNKYHHFPGKGAHDSKDSPYYDWYNFTCFPDEYECWWGFDTLPNVCETNPAYMKYITGENGVLEHWLDMGAKGWRLDVADELPDAFLKELRKCIKRKNPDALIIGEVWENAITKVSYGAQREFLLGLQCDTVMNYPFLNAVTDFVISADADKFYNSIMRIINDYPAPSVDCLMNMLSTHDTARVLCRLGAVTIPERKFQADAKLSESELCLGISRLKMASVLQFTLPGIPCIYYGDEVGMQGFGDPSCRGTFPWGQENTELLEFHKTLGNMRKNNKESFGVPIEFEMAENGIVRFTRGDILVTVNNTDEPLTVENLPVIAGFGYDGQNLLPKSAIVQRR